MKLKKLFIIIFICFVWGFFSLNNVFAQTVSLAPASQTMANNTDFSVAINISSVSNLFYINFDLNFLPSLISFVSVQEGSFLNQGCQTSLMAEIDEHNASKLVVGYSRLGAACGGVSGSGILMTLNFRTLAQNGVNSFSFANNSLCLLSEEQCNDVVGTWNSAVVTVGITPPSDTTVPSVPTGLSASAVSTSQINLSWTVSTDNVSVSGYRIYRNGTQIDTSNTNSYQATGLSAATSYSFTVAAYDAAGNVSAQSISASATTLSTVDTTAPTISNVAISSVDSSSAALSWQTNESADSQIEYGLTAAYGSQTSLNTALVSSHSQTITGLSSNTTYHYRVKSRDGAGNLAVSGDYNFKTSVSSAPAPSPTPTPAPTPTPTPTPTPAVYPEGSLIKLTNDQKVYLIKDNKKCWITTAEVFVGNGYLWQNIKIATQAELNQYLEGTPFSSAGSSVSANVLLYKLNNSDKVYALINNKYLHWIPNPIVFNHYQYQWNSINIISQENFNKYQIVKLIKAINEPKIYYIKHNTGQKKWIINEAVFNAYNNKWSDVMEVDKVEIDSYPTVNLARTANDPEVYLLENTLKRWIKTAQVFAQRNYQWDLIDVVLQSEIDQYQEGVAIE